MKACHLFLIPAVLALSPVCSGAPDVFARPVPAAGDASSTLVVYDTLAKPFSLVNEVAVISTLLGRIQTRVETRQSDAVTVREINAADYVIVAGVSDVPRLGEPQRQALAESGKPVAYLGWASQLALPGRGPKPRAQSLYDARVKYSGRDWTMSLDPFVVVGAVPANPLAEIISPAPRRYLAWRDGPKFAFAALPVSGASSLIFSDLLLDFYAVKQTPPPALMYLVQDFHPGSDANAFRRLVDYFAARGDRFAVSVRLKSPLPAGTVPMPDGQFFEVLRYAQTHGGRVVLRPETSDVQVRPLLDAGVVPLACELPGGGNRPSRPLQGISFGTALGKIEAAGPKGSAQAVTASSVMAGEDHTLVIPLNVDPGSASTTERGIAAEVSELASLRGTMAGVVVPAWFPFQKMRDTVDEARRAGLRGTDLSGAPNWIKTDQAIITGKNVHRAFSVPGGSSAQRVSFDGAFQRVGQGRGEAAVATAILLHQER